MLPSRSGKDYTSLWFFGVRVPLLDAAHTMRRTQLTVLFPMSALCVLGLACSSAQSLDPGFETDWQWDQGKEASTLVANLQGRTGIPPAQAAVGVTGHGLVGRTLPHGALWKYEGEVNVLPTVIGDVVAFSGDNKITVLRLRDGHPRYSIPSGGRRLEGMGYDGKHAVLLLVDEDDARPDQIVFVNEQGQVRYSGTTLERVGTPAAVGGQALVPWGSQYVSFFDLTTGEDLGRLWVRDAPHHVEATVRGVLILGKGVLPLSPALAQNPSLPSARLPRLAFPGDPSWPRDGSKPRPARAQPVDFYAAPVQSGARIEWAHDRFAATYYDIVIGFDARGARVQWATHFERSVIGGTASEAGLGLCLEDGTLLQLAWQDGTEELVGSLENRLRACVLSPWGEFGADPTEKVARPPLEQQILTTITSTGPNLAAAHALLVEDLGRRTGESTTIALLSIAQDPLAAAPVIERASAALAERTDGAAAMIRALEDSAPTEFHGSLLRQAAPRPTESDNALRKIPKRAPPLLALAKALSRMGAREAATPLARYLQAPALPAAEARAILTALRVLGDREQASFVFEFFATYRAVGGSPEFITALGEAATFVWQQGSPDEIRLIEKAKRDSLTHPAVKQQLEARLQNATKSAAPDAPGGAAR